MADTNFHLSRFPTLDAGDRVPRWTWETDAVTRVLCTALNAVTHVPRTASRDEVQDWAQINPKKSQNSANHIKSPKANMLKFGDVSFDWGFEW